MEETLETADGEVTLVASDGEYFVTCSECDSDTESFPTLEEARDFMAEHADWHA